MSSQGLVFILSKWSPDSSDSPSSKWTDLNSFGDWGLGRSLAGIGLGLSICKKKVSIPVDVMKVAISIHNNTQSSHLHTCMYDASSQCELTIHFNKEYVFTSPAIPKVH